MAASSAVQLLTVICLEVTKEDKGDVQNQIWKASCGFLKTFHQ